MVYATDYQAVPASQTNATIAGQNGVGSVGDILEKIVIIPTTTAAGNVSIKDGSNTAITIFNTGTLVDLKPIVVSLGLKSVKGAWQVTTGANVAVIAAGRFQ